MCPRLGSGGSTAAASPDLANHRVKDICLAGLHEAMAGRPSRLTETP